MHQSLVDSLPNASDVRFVVSSSHHFSAIFAHCVRSVFFSGGGGGGGGGGHLQQLVDNFHFADVLG